MHLFGHSRFVAISLVFFVAVSALLAQVGTGSIQGTVTDSSGAVIVNAKVVVQHVETGTSFHTQSNGVGFFIFPSARQGKYRVTIESPGMQNWEAAIELQTGQEAVLAPVLKIGGTATQVAVAGDVTALVTTASPTLASVVDRARIEELPLNGRFLPDLLTVTTPGLEKGYSGTRNPQAFGFRDGLVKFVQDGAPINDENNGQIATRPPGMDTVQEYRLELSVPSAKYSAPVTALFATRSGTNLWHGGLFYTGRNNGFGRARQRQDFYTKPPEYIVNAYGASLGGPVRIPHVYNGKDRTFFFTSWEVYSLRSSSTFSTSEPTQAMQQGDFSQLTNSLNQAITLYNPYSTQGAAQNYSRVPYPGNIIPVTQRSPLAAFYFNAMPQPTQLNINPSISANYFGPSPSNQDDWTYTARLDHRLGDNDQIFGRYTIGQSKLVSRRTSNNSSPISLNKCWNYQIQDERNNNVALTWDHIFGQAFFMETVLTGSRVNIHFQSNAGSCSGNMSAALGIPNPFNENGAPNLSSFGFSLSGTGLVPRSEITQPVSLEQNYTRVLGKHEIQFGWRYRRMMLYTLPDRPGEGTISFASLATGLYDPASGTAYNSGARTGDNMANFFLGVAASYSQTAVAPPYVMLSNQASGYLQDVWKVTRDLTLSLGLRYDYLPAYTDSSGSNAVFDFANHAIVRPASTDRLIQEGATTPAILNQYAAIGVKFETPAQAGIHGDLVHVGQLNFNPRVGFAYNARLGKRSVVVRGGFGEYHYNLGGRMWVAQRSIPPLSGTVSYNIGSASTSPDGLANYGLRTVPTLIAGTSAAVNAIDPNSANAIGRGVLLNTIFARDMPVPLAREWNLTIESEIMHNTLLRLAYVGTQGRNQDELVYYNGQPNNYVYYKTTGKVLPTGTYSAVALRDYDQTTYGDIRVYQNSGYSNFNGIQVEVQRRFDHGLGFQWFYVMSNAMWMGSGGEFVSQTGAFLPDPVTFLPGSVPSNLNAYNRFYSYARDPNLPKHRVSWNVLYDLPFGRGRTWLSNSGRFIDRVVGGWQLAAYSQMNSRYITLPTGNWGTFSKIKVSGTQYPVMDCRSGTCLQGYLWYNSYIPANQINTQNAAGQCTGVCGVPSSYQPSNQPIWPIPANPSPSDPNNSLYGTNNVYVPLQNGTQQLVGYDTGLNPWRNQYIPGPWAWTVNSSLFKVIPINDRFKLRLNMDVFNVFNMPGTPMPNASTGIISLQNSDNAPRTLQWTMRLNW